MKTKAALLATSGLIALSMLATPAVAGTKMKPQACSTNCELEERIKMLESQLSDQKIAYGNRIKALEDQAFAVQWSFDNGRPTIRTGDGRFEMAIRGRFQFDFWDYYQDSFNPATTLVPAGQERDLNTGAYFRRARLGIEGRAFRDFIYEMRVDFAGGPAEAAATANILRVGYVGIPNWRIAIGAMQPSISLADATSSADIAIIERASVVNVYTSIGGDNARRGVEVVFQKADPFGFGNGDNIMAAAYLTGNRVGGGAGSQDEQTQVLGRLAYRLYSDADTNIHLGGSFQHRLAPQGGAPAGARNIALTDRPESRANNALLFGNGFVGTGNLEHKGVTAYGFEAGFSWKNFAIQGEHYTFDVDRFDYSVPPLAADSLFDPTFSGWYVEGSWILTGETKRYATAANNNNMMVFGAPRPASPFSLGGTWGAWELVTRYSVMDFNHNEGVAGVAIPVGVGAIRGGEQEIATIGMNWYLNNNVKMQFNYQNVDIDRLNAAGGQTGQTYQAFGMRTQFSF